jgi:hypothetical protein
MVPIALPFLMALQDRLGARDQAAATARRLAVWTQLLDDPWNGYLRQAFDEFRKVYGAVSRPSSPSASAHLAGLNRTITLAPGMPYPIWTRADFLARHRDWAGALVDYEFAAKMRGNSDDTPWIRALLQAAFLGERERYARLSELMRLRYESTPEDAVAERVLKVNLLLTPTRTSRASASPPAADRLARTVAGALSRATPDPLFPARGWTTLALAYFRAGNPGQALTRLESAARSAGFKNNGPLQAMAHTVEAMALMRLGREDAARQALAQARGILRPVFPDATGSSSSSPPLGYDWHDWLVARTLFGEAEAQVIYDPIFPANPFAPER